MSLTIQELILNNVSLGHPYSNGWHPVLCPVCQDHGRKGLRAGFKFLGHDGVEYNCFNCDHHASYTPNSQPIIPDRMWTVFRAFDLSEHDLSKIQFDNYTKFGHVDFKSLNNNHPQQIQTNEPKQIQLPDNFYPLKDAESTDKMAIIARDFLTNNRLIDPNAVDFYLAHPHKDKRLNKWYGRIIFPIYKKEKLIFYQGRDLIGNMMHKYISADVPKTNIIYGYEHLYVDKDAPLFITEGWFDAYLLQGCSILGKTISGDQFNIINLSPRTKVYIPDRTGDGGKVAHKLVDKGWSISIPDAPDCKDPTDAFKKYGKLYTIKSLIENIVSGFEAELQLNMFIK